jgi:hypothetical protein
MGMYSIVEIPKRITKKWQDKAFAPLKEYLRKHHAEKEKEIMSWMSFKGNWEGKFIYENTMTSGQIIFDQAGQLILCNDNALDHEYKLGYERIEVRSDFVHPNVDKWIESTVSQKKADVFRAELRMFLHHVWGPLANFDFSDLKVGYPLKGSGSPYCLYVYPSRFSKLMVFQFVGDEILTCNCSLRQYQKFQNSEREFRYQGWHLTTLIREFLIFEPDLSITSKVVEKGIEIADWRINGVTYLH